MRRIVSILCLLALPAALAAQPMVCAEGQYLLGVSAIPKVRAKTVALAQGVISGEYQVRGLGRRAIMVSDPNERFRRKSRNVCQRLREQRRRRLLENRGMGVRRKKPIPATLCSCNQQMKAFVTPNDPNFSWNWGLHQYNDTDMDMPEAWDLTTGSDEIVVAVIDTGVDYNHVDLAPNIWSNPGEIGGNGIDDDGNGYVDDVHGINAITNSGDPMDDHGHGSHVSGTIGAKGNDGVGICGVNWNVRIMGLKFLSSSGSGWASDAIKALDYILWMKQHGVDVLLSNNSWGGGGFSPVLYDAIRRTRDAGILFVAAAGNAGQNTDINPMYPAAYDLDNIVSVAAVDSGGGRAGFSNYGAITVDIAAPGAGIYSTLPGNQYASWSGTSMAAPHVSGAFALLKAFAPLMSWSEMKDTLLNSGPVIPHLAGIVKSERIVNAYSTLLNAGPPPPPTPTPTATPTPTSIPSPTPLPGPYTVAGNVVIGASPIEGALVTLTTQGGTWIRTTGAGGEFSFGSIENSPGAYSISVRYPGGVFTAQAGYLDRNLSLEFSGGIATYFINGTVINLSKDAIEGVTVDAGELGQLTTGPDGSFSFAAKYGTEYKLKAELPGHQFQLPDLRGTVAGDVHRIFVGKPG